MLEKFLSYINDKKILSADDRVLLSVSGGMDSMVMLHLFLSCRWPVGVAHINHGLRGSESDQDADLVRTFCEERNIPFFQYIVPPGQLAGAGMQERARHLRFTWLTKTANEKGFSRIATAHHASDSIETALINLVRGTGLEGLEGIQPVSGTVVHPLLCFTPADIAAYAQQYHVPYRHDRSNDSDDYLRNRVRHHVLPALEKASPGALSRMRISLLHIAEAADCMGKLASDFIQSISRVSQSITILPLQPLYDHPSGPYLLWYYLRRFGFHRVQSDDMLKPTHTSGARWQTDEYVVWLTRGELHLVPNALHTYPRQAEDLSPPCHCMVSGQSIALDWAETPETITTLDTVQYLDGGTVTLPLRVRVWQAGDRISPLGLGGRSQKVKDYLTHKKVPSSVRKDILVVESPEGIVSIPGYGIADWAKVTDETKSVLRITLLPLPAGTQSTP